jgi:intracellular sulfur oxidation DsrE/DsrF family protein
MRRIAVCCLAMAMSACLAGIVPAAAQSATEGRPLALSEAKSHRIALHISEDRADKMTMILGNAKNAIEYFDAKGEPVEIQIVAYGPGVTMFRADTSPVKDKLAAFRSQHPNVTFVACHNTLMGMSKRENKSIPVVPEATEVPAGIGHLVELQEQGWIYVKP